MSEFIVKKVDQIEQRLDGLVFPEVPDHVFVWIIPDPSVSTVGQIPIPWNCTVIEVKGNVQGGTSVTFNIEERGTLGSSGTNILSSDMVADTNGETVSSGFNNSSLSISNYLAIDISAVSGVVTDLTVRLKARA